MFLRNRVIDSCDSRECRDRLVFAWVREKLDEKVSMFVMEKIEI